MTAETFTVTSPNAEERHSMIAVAAYFLAEQRGFLPGEAERDWELAEHQIECMLERLRQAGKPTEGLSATDIRNALRLLSD
ncbi:DUF2934 domain-containing protein [Thiorhodovibrio frisius]|uniref:DUF2934 domain-containing protein n=1 Tax=Thiorhodovibrio frisius TaxID=631362 RepID=H8Z0D9_9GAMM|nr:DUF2934 domain-containing protein [Thiorhodovibrio frisius]EIC21240.1 Protein of unknown function (DUF2934) [Thiorhodovibrio frisius]WPL23816.1 hypothetical protein Thiofri_04019 [Thiorhodovibrio frisius]